jgi:hypothetical protein
LYRAPRAAGLCQVRDDPEEAEAGSWQDFGAAMLAVTGVTDEIFFDRRKRLL